MKGLSLYFLFMIAISLVVPIPEAITCVKKLLKNMLITSHNIILDGCGKDSNFHGLH